LFSPPAEAKGHRLNPAKALRCLGVSWRFLRTRSGQAERIPAGIALDHAPFRLRHRGTDLA